MYSISAKIRKGDKNAKALNKEGLLPAVLYGSKIKNLNIAVNRKEFEKLFHEAGESSLIKLQLPELKKDLQVLVHDIQRESVSGNIIHIDFYYPSLTKEVEAKVPLVFEGISSAVKDLGGTLIRNLSEIEIKALPQNLPREIKVSIEKLTNFEDKISVKDLNLPREVSVQKGPDELVVWVAAPAKVEEELEKPAEEKVEEVELIKKERAKGEEPVEKSEKENDAK